VSGVRMSPAEFEALRARGLQVISATKPTRRVEPAKARTAVTRNAAFVPTTRIICIPKADPRDEAMHTIKAIAGRVMAVDISTAKCGLAWGRPGEKPEGTLCYGAGDNADIPEGRRLYSMAKAVAWEAASKQVCLVIFSEFYASRMMLAFRANSALRGAIMAELARRNIDALPVAEITARKAAGVDISRPKNMPKGYMKARARARLEELGLGYLQEDEGDAALLLLGSKDLVQFGDDK
jgi:hypothetical protein